MEVEKVNRKKMTLRPPRLTGLVRYGNLRRRTWIPENQLTYTS